ncbi:MAG TPA: hypothetical protein VLJ59_02805 [Mycobacteriales bacterium]|nr:hypothetical protein [Mycobacteriales bacterium]
MQWILAVLAIVVLLSVISFVVTAVKWLLLVALVVAVAGGVRAIMGGSRRARLPR